MRSGLGWNPHLTCHTFVKKVLNNNANALLGTAGVGEERHGQGTSAEGEGQDFRWVRYESEKIEEGHVSMLMKACTCIVWSLELEPEMVEDLVNMMCRWLLYHNSYQLL